MTRSPAPALSAAEAATVARFDAAPVPAEFDPERVETVARAISEHTQLFGGGAPIGHPAFCSCGWEGDGFARHLAAAAIAALPPSPAEEAVKRVEALAEEWGRFGRGGGGGEGAVYREVSARIRAALASPAPAPHGDDRGVVCPPECGEHQWLNRVTAPRDRYWQCDDTCTVDCGACKGAGRPAPQGEEGWCTKRISAAHDDEDTYECGRPATVEALTTSGQWEPHCASHVAGWPTDRVRSR